MAPSIFPEDLLLGLASAVLLLWAMDYIARSGFDRTLARPSVDDLREGLFSNLPLKQRLTQLPLVLSLFAHLFWASSLPWMEKLLPREIPVNWEKYDLVVAQFKPTDATLVLPPKLWKKEEEKEKEKKRKEREKGKIDNPGLGNQKPTPKKQALDKLSPRLTLRFSCRSRRWQLPRWPGSSIRPS